MKGDEMMFDKNRKKALDERASLKNDKMPSVINLLAEQRQQLGERNRIYIEDICSKTGEAFNTALNRIVAEHEEYKIFEAMETCYSELCQDETAWKEHLEERNRWKQPRSEEP